MTTQKPTARERLAGFLDAIEPVADAIERGDALREATMGLDVREQLRILAAMEGGSIYVDLHFPDARPLFVRSALVGLRLAREHQDIERMRRNTRGRISPEQARLSARLARVLRVLEGFAARMRNSGGDEIDTHG